MARSPLILLALSFALLAPASASAAWLPIEDLGGLRFSDSEHTIASNDRGDTVVAWKDSRGIQVAVSRRGAAFGPARGVPGDSGSIRDVRLSLSEDGRALISWRRHDTRRRMDRIYVTGLKVDGGFGTTRPVTPSASYVTFQTQIGPGGRFTVLYATSDGSKPLRPAYARSAPPSGRLGPRRAVATGEITMREVWYVGTRPYLAYTRSVDRDTKLFERRIEPPGSARVVATVQRFGLLGLDTASNGRQVALWTRDDSRLFAAVRRTGEAFRGQEIDNRIPPQEVDVAVARSGAALVAWRDFVEATIEDEPPPSGQEPPGRIVTSYKPAGGSFQATRAFRADPEPTQIGPLTADIESGGLAVLGFGAARFSEGWPYIVLIDQGGEPDVHPIGERSNTARAAMAAIDERNRPVASWRDGTRVLAMRGDFGR